MAGIAATLALLLAGSLFLILALLRRLRSVSADRKAYRRSLYDIGDELGRVRADLQHVQAERDELRVALNEAQLLACPKSDLDMWALGCP